MVVAEHPEATASGLGLAEVAAPRDLVVLVLLVEHQFRVDRVLQNLRASTVADEISPAFVNHLALYVVVEEWVFMQHKSWTLVHIEARQDRKQHRSNNSVHAGCNYRALAEAEVPNLHG